MTAPQYSVPEATRCVLDQGILKNPRLKHNIPEGAAELAAENVKFLGTNQPSVPVNWRFAESVSALKAYEASVLSLLIKKKYGVDAGEIHINTYVCHSPNFIFGTNRFAQRPCQPVLHVPPHCPDHWRRWQTEAFYTQRP
jgi:hypothetical protein